MKRYISLLLVLALLPMCLAVPVMADEIEDDSNWIELLDYGTVNASGTNVFGFTNSTTITLAFPTGSKAVGHVNMLVYSSVPITDAYVTNSNGSVFDFVVLQVSGGVYRIYGDMNQYIYPSLKFTLVTGSSTTAYCEMLSCRVTTTIFNYRGTTVSAEGIIYKATPIYPSFDNTSDLAFCAWTYDNESDFYHQSYNGLFSMSFSLTDWQRYDFIDLELTFNVNNISSVGATFGPNQLPYVVNDIFSDDGRQFLVSVTLDLRDIDRTSGNVPIVVVTGNGFYNSALPDVHSNSIYIRAATGYIKETNLSQWGYWFRNLKSWLDSNTSNIASAIANQTTNISEFFINLQANIGKMFSDQTDTLVSTIQTHQAKMSEFMGVMRVNIGKYITEQTDAVNAAISGLQSNLDTWIKSQTTSINYVLNGIGSSISTLQTNIGTWFTEQTDKIVSWGTNITYAINTGVDRLVEAINPDNDTSDFNDKLNNSLGQLGEAGAAMDSVSRPDVGDMDFNVTAKVPVAGMSALGSIVNVVYKNDALGPLMWMYFTLALAAFVIFGRN